jgi:methyltransferase-like protein/cyclopropane fatty-acyl-phospholipid synthase-like methyltransferase
MTDTNTYDDVPYPSHAYKTSSPEAVGGVAKVFGLDPVLPEKARVLELGCASGGNIIPLAERYPDSEIVGIDYSKVQIDAAEATIKSLSLKNITFKCESILDFDTKGKPFDYIIVHGIYSWVDKEVQNKILEICGDCLSDNGVAYISYNTLPGWNAVRTIREMMLYHCQNFDDNDTKLAQAANMLKFVSDSIPNENSTYKKTLESEIKTLEKADRNYLFHDHLEANNEPCYFHDFATNAAKNKLSYLGDSNISTMFIGNFTPSAAEKLGAINDIVRQEQYMDFVSNRRFRSTLMVKAGTQVNRNVSIERLENLQLIPNLAIVIEKAGDLEDGKPVDKLKLQDMNNPEVTATLTGEEVCSCYREMIAVAPKTLTLKEIVTRVTKKYNYNDKELREKLDTTLLMLLFKGLITVSYGTSDFTSVISKKPKVSDLTRLEARTKQMLANQVHAPIRLRDDQRVILQYLDGNNNLNAINKAVKEHISKGELTVSIEGKPVSADSAQIDETIQDYVTDNLTFLSRNALLVA